MTESVGTRGVAVVLAEGPLTQWRRDLIGITALGRAGLETFYLDCELLVRPGGDPERAEIALNRELEKLQDLLDAGRECYVFSYYELSDARLRLVRDILESRNQPWCRVYTGFIPAPCLPQDLAGRLTSFRFRLRRFMRQTGKLRMLASTVRKLFPAVRLSSGNLAPRYVLLEGLAAEENCPHSDAMRIYGHSLDYGRVSVAGLLDAASKAEGYCVFLDSNEARHEDFGFLGFSRRDTVNEDWYRQALQRSFSIIEQATGLRLVVAPHPRYKYPLGYFGSYEVRAGDTAQTVASSSLVVGHYSTSLGLAVIFHKPVVLLNSRTMMTLAGGFTGRYIKGFQRALGCPALDMDQPDAGLLGAWSTIDARQFSTYSARYVRHPSSPESSMWENAVGTIARHEGWKS